MPLGLLNQRQKTQGSKEKLKDAVTGGPCCHDWVERGQHCRRVQRVELSGCTVHLVLSLELRDPRQGGGQGGLRLSLRVWVSPTRQVKVPNLLNQMRKWKRTGWLWRKPGKCI